MKSITEQLTTRIISEVINERKQDSGQGEVIDPPEDSFPPPTPFPPHTEPGYWGPPELPIRFPDGTPLNPYRWHWYHSQPGSPLVIPGLNQQHGPADPEGPHGKHDRTFYPGLFDRRFPDEFRPGEGTEQDWEGFEYKPDELFPQKKPPQRGSGK
tara:strand:+ start:1534 stop:1998 length:465 start_codon:yes stop_codon:yes gene_type:complete